jgi:translin
MSLRDILERIREELAKRDKIRLEIQMAARRATRLSKQTIFLVHKTELIKAENMLREAENILANLSELSRLNPDLFYTDSVDLAFQEYAEACIFLKLVKDKRFVDFKEINVSMDSYVLGLSDVIGEFRRRALDSIRKGEDKLAEESLEHMENIYSELINHDELFILIPGLRRKCDVARHVIEATRGDVAIEVRRSLLEKSIEELKEAITKGREQ